MTSWFVRRMRCRTSADPMKPAPPVTKIFILSTLLPESSIHQGRERMTIVRERTRQFLEQRKALILLGRNDVSSLERPWNRDFGIVPTDASVERWGVIITDLIHHDNVRIQGQVPMSEPFRNVQLVPCFGRQFYSDMIAIRRGAASQVDRYVQDPSAQHADQFGLGGRRRLEVEPP